MGRTLSTNRHGERVRDLVEVVNPPCSEYNPETDINDTAAAGVRMLSPFAEIEDGDMSLSPPFNLKNPRPLVMGITEMERTRTVRNNDRADY